MEDDVRVKVLVEEVWDVEACVVEDVWVEDLVKEGR